MEVSIQEVARLTGTTSRTLRHYDAKGLLRPSGVGAGGMRFYDDAAVMRLQRVLLLRQLGLGLTAIAAVLDSRTSDTEALRVHAALLRRDRERIDRQIAAVERTISAATEGRPVMAEEMLDGFDHTQYREEVEQRWGAEAYERGDRWWQGLGSEGQQAFLTESADLTAAWQAAHERDLPLAGEQVRGLAARHIAWIAQAWGGVTPSPEQIRGLAQMYVADERFAATYGGLEGASYVRDALVSYVG